MVDRIKSRDVVLDVTSFRQWSFLFVLVNTRVVCAYMIEEIVKIIPNRKLEIDMGSS